MKWLKCTCIDLSTLITLLNCKYELYVVLMTVKNISYIGQKEIDINECSMYF